MFNSEELIEKLLNLYNVSTVAQLSEVIETSQATISNWKIRNSVGAIKKKCRELGIYNEIFGDGSIQKIDTNNGINSFNNHGDVKQKNKESNSSLKFDDDITAILHTASTVINDSNKDSFKKLIKEWIVENI